jgi:hypothetical protein
MKDDHGHERKLLGDLLRSAACELFAAYNVDVSPTPVAPPTGRLVAVIGFSGPTLRGGVGMMADRQLLEAVGIESTRAGSDDPALDLLGELANQLLGRLKNKLLAHAISVSVTLPIALRGIELRFVEMRGADVECLELAGTSGTGAVWLDARWDEEFEVVSTPVNDPGLEEGSLLLF